VSDIDTFLPESASRLRPVFEGLDTSFAENWATHAGRLFSRPGLDARTRFLVLTAQYTVTGRHGPLEENLGAALDEGVDPRDLLEVILQAYVYTGPWVVSSACGVFERVLDTKGIDLPPSTASDGSDRDLDEEREAWNPSDAADPRLGPLLDRYGWHGISTGLRLRPNHHLNLIDTLDILDPEFLRTWLDAVYDGMYSRGVLDDGTRLLCVVGATLALGETHQSRRHMRAALRSGATARELLEVIFHTTAVFGHPYVMPAAVDDLVRIANDEGRLGELAEGPAADRLLRIAEARAARRGGIQDGVAREER
jgi:alkylhydroperoxidase/carboxymuconolactone decarboxylase family protein YurZ